MDTGICSSDVHSPVVVEVCFTSTETVWLIRDGEPRTVTSTFTQRLSSVHGPRHSVLKGSWESNFE